VEGGGGKRVVTLDAIKGLERRLENGLAVMDLA
jgi:hypothetical protein